MANSNYSDFKEIVRDIDDRKILLPDFQRDFVWKDEERQKKIGSITNFVGFPIPLVALSAHIE